MKQEKISCVQKEVENLWAAQETKGQQKFNHTSHKSQVKSHFSKNLHPT